MNESPKDMARRYWDEAMPSIGIEIPLDKKEIAISLLAGWMKSQWFNGQESHIDYMRQLLEITNV